MPLIQWIMQNLQPTAAGVLVDGVAMVEKLMNVVAAGGGTVSGVSDNYIIKIRNGVVIDGFSPVQADYNITTTGGVEISGEAFLSFDSVLRKLLPYSLGDTVYTEDGLQYSVLGFYWDLDAELTYEITNGNTTFFTPQSLIYRDRSLYYLSQLALIDQQIAALSA
jgi:hypothetical protein